MFVREFVPKELGAFPDLDLPDRARHPAGFALSGAPVGTFLRSGLLLAGQRVFGRRYEGSSFYQNVEKDMAFGIMPLAFPSRIPEGCALLCAVLACRLSCPCRQRHSLLRLCGTCQRAETSH